MTTKEKITLATNGLIAVALTLFVLLGKTPWFVGVIIMVAVLTPSSAPAVIAAIRQALGEQPPKGPSILGGVLIVVGALGCVTGCSPAGAEPALPAQQQACPGLDIDACSAKYETALTACSATAMTRAESESCEDGVRAFFGRPPRPAKKSGGAS